jgi:hypothetical protein
MDAAGSEHPIARRRLRDLQQRSHPLGPVQVGPEYLYRPDDILLTAAAEELLAPLLADRFGGEPYRHGAGWRGQVPAHPKGNVLGRIDGAGLPLRLWQVPRAFDLPAVVAELRETVPAGDPGFGVSLNHVLGGEPNYRGGPGSEPRPAEAPARRAAAATRADGVDLAVLDTGLPADLALLHPDLVGRTHPDADDVDVLDDDGDGVLDTEAGHGVFICGLVEQVAPMVGVDPGRVLDSTGYGDDLSVGLELAETQAPVVNLSLGAYTHHDRPPLALELAIDALGPDRVVVAAAGNASSDRPFWPAAFPQVIAVAGYDSAAMSPAHFTNHGSWVDACAPGVDLVSAYVQGTWRSAADGDVKFHGWARWSGTSFAAPLVAAEIARRYVQAAGSRTAREVADELMAELPAAPWPGMGRLYRPPVSL